MHVKRERSSQSHPIDPMGGLAYQARVREEAGVDKPGEQVLDGAAASDAAPREPRPAGRTVIAVERLSKLYDTGASPVTALQDIDFSIAEGEFVAIVGPSGC